MATRDIYEQMKGFAGVPVIDLTPDCGSCAALCCVLLPFDGGAAFAYAKPALLPCVHLTAHRCTIHDRLADAGFSGCVRFNCFGAGQRVVQQVFGGKSWRDDAGLLEPMEAAFRAMRALHEAHAMLEVAAELSLPAPVEAERQGLIMALDAGREWTADSLMAFAAGPLLAQVRRYLAGLRALTPPRR